VAYNVVDADTDFLGKAAIAQARAFAVSLSNEASDVIVDLVSSDTDLDQRARKGKGIRSEPTALANAFDLNVCFDDD
jgi:hypothetical protein